MAFSPPHDIREVTKQIANGKMTGFAESFVNCFPGRIPAWSWGFLARTGPDFRFPSETLPSL